MCPTSAVTHASAQALRRGSRPASLADPAALQRGRGSRPNPGELADPAVAWDVIGDV